MDKTVATPAEAVADIPDGASLAVGGFGLVWCSVGADRGVACARCFRAARLCRTTVVWMSGGWASCWRIGGSLGPRVRMWGRTRSSRGSTCPASWRSNWCRRARWPSGSVPAAAASRVSTLRPVWVPRSLMVVCRGGMTRMVRSRWRRRRRRPATSTAAAYVLEEGIVTDFALVRAARGDIHGNLVFHASARNFNPLCGMAGRVTIAEVEELVGPGELDPDLDPSAGHLRAAGGAGLG